MRSGLLVVGSFGRVCCGDRVFLYGVYRFLLGFFGVVRIFVLFVGRFVWFVVIGLLVV